MIPESDNEITQIMNSKLFLESIVGGIENNADSFLLRAFNNSLNSSVGLKNRFTIEELDTFLSDFKVDSSKKAILSWIEDFSVSREPSSVITLSSQEGNIVKLIIERISGRPNIFIFGAGHVGQALALISTLLGYEVVIVDDRVEFASRKRLPDSRIKIVVDNFDRAIRNVSIGPRSAAVIVTRGHQYDEICLENLLRVQLSYIGMIGSKRRVISIFKRLRQQGFADNDLNKVHAPIGLSIGAKSPQEIAVAILAEIIAEANKASSNK